MLSISTIKKKRSVYPSLERRIGSNQVLIRLVREVVVDDDVDSLDVNTAAEQICGNQDALVEVLEGFKSTDSFFLLTTK